MNLGIEGQASEGASNPQNPSLRVANTSSENTNDLTQQRTSIRHTAYPRTPLATSESASTAAALEPPKIVIGDAYIDNDPSFESSETFNKASDLEAGHSNEGFHRSELPVPEIVIQGPGPPDDSPQSVRKPPLKKATPLHEYLKSEDENLSQSDLRPRLRPRRHSVHSISSLREQHELRTEGSAPTAVKEFSMTSEWTLTERSPKNGWRMRARCSNSTQTNHTVDIVVVYLYNSSKFQKTSDEDADLDIFRYYDSSKKTTVRMIPSVQRARTDLGHQRQLLPSFLSTPPKEMSSLNPLDAKRPRRPFQGDGRASASDEASDLQSKPNSDRINWLHDHDMLLRQIPGSRVITVGFDIGPVLSTLPNLETAAEQLNEYLSEIEAETPQIPILFLGHTLGGLFIIQALANSTTGGDPSRNVISRTAGLFLASCSVTSSSNRTRLLADLHGAKSSDKIFSDLAGTPVIQRLGNAINTKSSFREPRQQRVPKVASACARSPKQNATSISIGFPVVQFITRGELASTQPSKSYSLADFLGVPDRTVLIEKDLAHAFKFHGSKDASFLRVVMLMQSALQTFQLLHAAATGNKEEIEGMVRRGININRQDRWNQSALQIAVRKVDEDLVSALLRTDRIEPNIQDNKLNTPLHHAIRIGNEAIVRNLLHHGADITLENHRKQTPKTLADKHKSRKHIAKMLKSRLIKGPDQSLSSQRLGSGVLPRSEEGRFACRNFQINVTEIFASKNSDRHWTVAVSVESLLYGRATLEDILSQVRPKEVASKTPICVWIHVPENNMIWIEDLFVKLNLHPAIWQGTRGSIESLRNRAIIPHVAKGTINSVFVPYLSYEAIYRQVKRTEYIQDVDEEHREEKSTRRIFERDNSSLSTLPSLHEGRANRARLLQVPLPSNTEKYPASNQDSDDSDSDFSVDWDPNTMDGFEEEEKALIKHYLHNPPALHVRRTLDQYYYHMLESTKERDADQVVSRWALNVKDEADHNILMVDQLWLWTAKLDVNHSNVKTRGWVGNESHNKQSDGNLPVDARRSLVVSCFPSRTGAKHPLQQHADDMRRQVLDPVQKKRDPIRETEDLISGIMETCFNNFDRLQDTEMLRFFQMFEDSIGSVDDEESRLFGEFQRGSNRLFELSRVHKFYDRKKQALLASLLDIRQEIKLLVEVKDIRDEINMILSVSNVQQSVVRQMGSEAGSDLLRKSNVAKMVQANVEDFSKLDSQAKVIQEKLNTLMDLKQKAANAWEAREAREYALEAGKQGRTMLVFTVVTIIFLPLSFMASFFDLGIAAFPKDAQSGETNWPLGTVAGLLFGISLSFSIPLIVLALNMGYCSSRFRELQHNYLVQLALIIIALLPQPKASKTETSYCKRWSERLWQHRQEYLKGRVAAEDLGELEGRTENDAEKSSLNSSDHSEPALHSAKGSFSRFPNLKKRTRRFSARSNMTDAETLVGEM